VNITLHKHHRQWQKATMAALA